MHTRIRRAREALGYTREQFAEKLDAAFLIWQSLREGGSEFP